MHEPAVLLPDVVAEIRREGTRPYPGAGLHCYFRATVRPWAMANDLLPVAGRITVPALIWHAEAGAFLRGRSAAPGHGPRAGR